MEREIGELFEVDGVKLKCVVKHDDCCLNCYFCDKGLQCMQQNCSSSNRKDSINVMFIQIKEQGIKFIKKDIYTECFIVYLFNFC